MDNWRVKRALRIVLPGPGEGMEVQPETAMSTADIVEGGLVEEHAETLQPIIGEYLKTLRDAFPADRIQELLAVLPPAEADSDREDPAPVPDEVDAVLAEWAEQDGDVVEDLLTAALLAAATAGFLAAFRTWMERFGLGHGPLPGMLGRLAEWARQSAGKILADIAAAARRAIARIIAAGRAAGLDPEAIMRQIQAYLDKLAEWAAGWALAEAAKAVSRGIFEAGLALGATKKQWITRRDERVCPACDGNETQGPIRIRDDFQSGHAHPPAHRGCRCSLDYWGVTRQGILHALGMIH